MVCVRVVHCDCWTGQNVAVVAAVKSAKPVRYLAAGEAVESAYREREAAGSPRHLGSRGRAGVELVDPDIATVPIYRVEEPVAPNGDSGEVRPALESERRRPGRPTVRGAGDGGAPA